MHKIFFIIILLLIPFMVGATGSGGFSDLKVSLDRIYDIDKEIKKDPTIILLKSLIRERKDLITLSKRLYKKLEVRNMSGATLDVTKRYKLELQKYTLSCEISALRAILSVVEKRYIREDSIIKKLPHSPLAYSGGVWGDPDREFVGSYHGSQRLRTGYGVHEAPLALYLDSLRVKNEYSNITYSGATSTGQLTKILSALHEGRHVLLWGDWCTESRYEDGIPSHIDSFLLRYFDIPAKNSCHRPIEERRYSWITSKGKMIYGLSGEHAFVLLGYHGPTDAPTDIIVWDTYTGKHIYPLIEWMRKWSEMDYRMLIVGEKK